MGGGLESRCVGRVYGADGAVYDTIRTVWYVGAYVPAYRTVRMVPCTAPSAPYTRPPPIQKLGAENHMQQLNI